ncbi:MAG: hypothetical protein LBK99_23930 [Opitutaceae bacterium]|jgi:hypothetical protein|nr:hypothetical protein [Opitutaceae bacterium]
MTHDTTKTNKLAETPIEDVFGFYGTIHSNEGLCQAKGDAAWKCAMRTITEVTGGNAILARNFLRATHGRHFSDATSFYRGSLASRIRQTSGERWVAKTLQRLTADGFADQLFAGDPAL